MSARLDTARIAPAPARSPRDAPSASPDRFAPLAFQSILAAYRQHGHRVAALDPLGLAAGDVAAHAELDAAVAFAALPPFATATVEWAGSERPFAWSELVAACRAAYCGPLTLQAAHVRSAEQRRWLYAEVERSRAQADAAARALLDQLVAAEAFELFQRQQFPRAKQFSAEGCEAMMPLIDAVLATAVAHGVREVALGMAHRGRLNALATVLGCPRERVLSLFTAAPDAALFAWDLKDHVGATTSKRYGDRPLRVLLAHNPSHLGSVTPVVCGMARAMQDRAGSTAHAMPVVVHGDAAFTGQGVVVETLSLSQARGFRVGGSVHVIVNNQIGSTIADPRDARSTLYAADVARAIDAPVLHVNADDPEAVVRAGAIAAAFRATFGADVVVDLCGYRRIGHFGGDDPTMTQPATQRRIREHAGVAERYARTLVERGVIDERALPVARTRAFDVLLRACADARSRPPTPATTRRDAVPPAETVDTSVPAETLRSILARLSRTPADFVLHANVERRRAQWEALAAAADGPVDWCVAETLAYATLLRNGYHVRLTGLDVGRGTFFHRDAVWHDQAADRDGATHVPLRHLGEGAAHFALFETPLSEEAVVGFEYGYSLRCGRDLVVWEAQFGDFVNNAQAIVDQFIASGERKWGYESALVLLLPHGAEGHGPEHSTGYLGRFLSLCGDANLRVAMPSTSGQLHHLLRRQALSPQRKPLVVMTPKMGLRADAASFTPLRTLAVSSFQPLVGDAECAAAQVTSVVIASGKLLHELRRERVRAGVAPIAIVALEELYPFPARALSSELARYPRLRHACFAQEEPRNHGAWHFVRDAIEAVLPPAVTLRYAGPEAAAPSGGCDPLECADAQRAIVASALGMPR